MLCGRERKAARRSSFSVAAIAEGGVGGAFGMNGAGRQTTVDKTAVKRTMLGISDILGAQIGPISSPSAPPKGFASDASAVADTRPLSENQRLEKRVGAARTKGCAKPMRIWPNITTPILGGWHAVPP